jgi:hypothetical protein
MGPAAAAEISIEMIRVETIWLATEPMNDNPIRGFHE